MTMITACFCGNCQLSGESLPSGVYPNILSSERSRLTACKALFTISPRSVRVEDLSHTQFKAQSHACVDLCCAKCRTTFRFFVGQATLYGGCVEPSKHRRLARFSSAEAAPAPIPSILRNYIQTPVPTSPRKKDLNSPHLTDTDFDLMFSRRTNPIVGSFRSSSRARAGLQNAQNVID
jgi:hypothetical protein